eukprot:GHVU01069549.1.p1 GENE.GHVU01069549.1~~GHVU01069549.1.p1  ORF type:complete len:101 (+),score=11.11 GHVU01069549.1:13-315(+)
MPYRQPASQEGGRSPREPKSIIIIIIVVACVRACERAIDHMGPVCTHSGSCNLYIEELRQTDQSSDYADYASQLAMLARVVGVAHTRLSPPQQPAKEVIK